MKTLGYYNGKIDELECMSVPMLDHACYFGDGVYDVTYCRNYKIFSLEEHVERFFASAACLRIEPPMTREALAELLCELVKKLDDGNQWVYMQLSRATDLRAHAFKNARFGLLIVLGQDLRDLALRNRLAAKLRHRDVVFGFLTHWKNLSNRLQFASRIDPKDQGIKA